MKNYCCKDMEYHATFSCDTHNNPFDCPDQLIYFNKDDGEHGLIIHDGGSSTVTIEFCPWCGSKL
ncbi:DUF6980 family protein [Pseudobacillus sp. 179-B 2D1 NHS]|uniref:DUF6980 family protein n=1 Tax=unclassified Pseudobacillus TaxID=2619284 RepID=UPI00387A61B2